MSDQAIEAPAVEAGANARPGAGLGARLSAGAPYAMLVLATLFWAGNFIAGRALRDTVDPVSLNLIRWTLALVVFAPFVWRAALAERHVLARNWLLILGLGATGIATFHTVVYLALRDTTAINALLMLSLAPALILVGTILFDGGHANGRQWLGVAVSFIGAVVLITRLDADVLHELRINRGDLWMSGAVVVWAAYSLLLKRRPPELSQNVALSASMLAGALMMLPVAAVFRDSMIVELTVETGLIILYVGLFASLIAFVFWSRGVAAFGPARAGQFIHLMPLFGAGLSAALLGDAVTLVHGVGAAFILVGILLVNRGGSAQPALANAKGD